MRSRKGIAEQMFKCTGNCSECGRCRNIHQDKILKEVTLPEDFKNDVRKGGYGIAFDIGTTTVVGSLWSLETGELIAQKGATNPQKQFGADVISRISYCIGSHEKIYELQHPLRMTIRSLMFELSKDANIDLKQIISTTFCGNTTMMLLFAGMPVDGIAAYPFTPDHIDGMVVNSKFDDYNIDGYLLPNIGGHIGGDISAGIISTRIAEFPGNAILLDIGTNGEIVIKAGDKLYGFSTAAGPAFEGANIECGMTGTAGAIESFSFSDDDIKYNVIGDTKPSGICGSGIMSAICEMLKMGIIDKDGRLLPYEMYTRIHPFSTIKERILDDRFVLVYGEKGEKDIVITQKDIRELQLAKGAIKAGINLLLKETSLKAEDIDKLYLAGGFGMNTPLEILLGIGILPDIPAEKISLVGNSALAGASMVLMSDKEKKYCEQISKEVTRIELNNLEGFQDEFVNSLQF